jgi:hypothetical protein
MGISETSKLMDDINEEKMNTLPVIFTQNIENWSDGKTSKEFEEKNKEKKK